MRKFKAVLEKDGSSLGWIVARLPFQAAEAWPERRGMHVRGTLRAADGRGGNAEFRTLLFPHPLGGQMLLVNKTLQKAAGVSLGAMVAVEIEPDMQERAAAIPPELEKLLKADKALQKFFGELSPSARRDIDRTITAPKSPAARIRRAEQMAERMLLAMEGELELPPILGVAFRKQPKARAGWQAMSPAQRRSHLLGIFYYQSPEAREKRTAKAVADALQIAAKIEQAGKNR